MTDEEVAKEVWAQLYPERRPWGEISKEAQDEWVKFVKAVREAVKGN
jgi:hypothetical protein